MCEVIQYFCTVLRRLLAGQFGVFLVPAVLSVGSGRLRQTMRLTWFVVYVREEPLSVCFMRLHPASRVLGSVWFGLVSETSSLSGKPLA